MADIKLVFEADTAPVDRAIRLLDNLEAEIRDVERAEKSGLISRKRATAETARLNQQITRLNTAAKGSAKDFRVFEKSLYGSGKAMRQKEIAMQQAGYQLQDFIVQVQAGTNPLIAFSQQGSQLAGFFAGPWGAAIGLGIAALGGLGTALLGTRSKAKSFGEQMDDLNTALGDYESVTKRLSDGEGLSKEFGNLANQAKEILLALKEIQGISLRQQLGEFGGIGAVSRQTVTERTGSFFGIPTFGQVERRDVGQVQAAQEFLGATGGTLAENASYAGQYLDLLEQIQKAETFEAQVEPAGKLAAFLRSHVESRGDEVKNLEEITKLQEVLLQITGMQARQDVKTSSKRKDLLTQIQTDAMAMEAELAEEAKQAATDANTIRSSLQSAYTLQRIADEDKVKQIENDRLKAVSAMQGAAIEATKQRANEEYAAYQHQIDQRFKGEQAMFEQAVKLSDDMVKKLEEDAERAKVAFENALTVLNFAPTPEMMQRLGRYAGRGTVSDRDPTYGEGGKSIYDEDKGPKLTTIEDTIKAFQRQIETEKTLMTLTGQRRREEELFLDLKYANQDADIKTSETRLRGLAQEMAAMEERSRVIEEARQQQEDIADMIGGSFEKAMMSIVDGTKSVEDAFRTMAAEIVKELYRVLVVQQMVNAAKSYFGFADGGVFSNGSVVPYANGGVVGSPTYFPMSGGRTGLMGEAGPEAIMPLKRGKNGKLGVQAEGGQQQSVVVNQSFNFQANGDDSVKRIIAKEAPKIAHMTQQQIMDSRRRGGQMKAVFG